MTKQEAWLCDYCGEIFHRPMNTCHEITINGEKEQWCVNCFLLFYQARKFVHHIQDHIDNEVLGLKKTDKVMCKICNKTIDEIFKEYA